MNAVPVQISLFLSPTAPPIEPLLAVIRPVKDVMVKAGETALFECHVRGPQDVDVDWLSDGKLIQPALLNCKMHFDGRRCRLLLNSVHEDDSGTYTCKLSTAKGEAGVHVSVKRTLLFNLRGEMLFIKAF